MAKVSDFYSGDLAATLNQTLGWLLARLNLNSSFFEGNVLETLDAPSFFEGSMAHTESRFDLLAQDAVPQIVLDPVAGIETDNQKGPDGFPINYSPTLLLSGNLLVNVLPLTVTTDVSGLALGLTSPAADYRVDVFVRTDLLYFKGSSSVADDGTWKVPGVTIGANPATAIAFLMPSASAPPAPGSFTSAVTNWVAHSNMGVGAKLRDYFVRIYEKTDIEYLKEDDVPIIVQDQTHARFGSSVGVGTGTPTAHVIFNDPQLGRVDLYSTLQNLAVFSDLPRSIEIPHSDPNFLGAGPLTLSNLPRLQYRSWIYSAALEIIALSVAGLWEAARRIVSRLNEVRDDPGYLPSQVLEDAADGLTDRWSLVSGAGTVANVFESNLPPSPTGSNVIVFTPTVAPAAWNFIGAGLPDSSDSTVSWRYKSGVNFAFILGVTSSTDKVSSIKFASTGVAGYDPVTKTITQTLVLLSGEWRTVTQNLSTLIAQFVAGETLVSVTSFNVEVDAAAGLSLDNLTVGTPQPPGSLSFSYDIYNGQVDIAYLRAGAIAWVAYAYGIYMELTGDFLSAATGLQSMLNFLFSLQSTDPLPRLNLITLGWGRYVNPGYVYQPAKLTSVSTEHNIDCFFAFEKASRVLPTAAQNLFDRRLITLDQYNSLKTTAATAATKAGQVRDAILNQLWIPAAGPVKGHFAQGASSAGLDSALAIDSAGSWAALFAHAVGDDLKAVECLEFIYEKFFLTNMQILKSSATDSYNQEYEQLTPFDGFLFFADSVGGYSGSPASVSMEGTWGAIAAYLRLHSNASLQAYFNANYTGGLDAFLKRLVASMKIVGSTTGATGVLDFSLASRDLPWEFSVRMTIAPTGWFWITATRNDILFWLQSAQADEEFIGRPVLKIPQGVQQSIQQLEGQSSIGALELETTDGGGFMTALVSGGKLEGRRVSLRVGYPGMALTDFVPVATQEIESVQTLPGLTGFKLQCRDLKRSAKSKIFRRGDDGFPVSDQHPRTLLANPIDVVLMVFQNELGLGQSPSLLESDWRLYDPARWNAAGNFNPTLIEPNADLDLDTFLFYRNGIFAGYLLDFTFTRPVEAKQFLEFEIFRALGGYLLVLADGSLSPRFFVPPYSFDNLFAFSDRNITVLPEVERHPLINQVTYRMDFDGNEFQTELLFVDATSLQQFSLAGQHIIESKGLRSARGGVSLAGLTATRIFRRYAGINPVSGAPIGGVPTLSVASQYMTLTVEAGDHVFAAHPLLPNFETGRRGVFDRIYEVAEKQPNYSEGTMTWRLLDTGWAVSKVLSRVAPTGTLAFTAASNSTRARYMFISADATKKYSDGSAGKTIW